MQKKKSDVRLLIVPAWLRYGPRGIRAAWVSVKKAISPAWRVRSYGRNVGNNSALLIESPPNRGAIFHRNMHPLARACRWQVGVSQSLSEIGR